MDELYIAKVQNTINEIQNQLSKIYVDTPVFRVLMQRSINQLNQLITHIGYLEEKLSFTIIPESTYAIDEDWNLELSHGTEANYLVNGKAIKLLVDHINYLHVLIENCPGNERK
jgi:hypothetical protein